MFCESFVKSKNRHPSWLYCTVVVRSSHWRCYIRKLFLKILQYPQETPVLESIFNLQTFKPTTLLKWDPNTCFPVNIAKFLILPILKNIWKLLLFNFSMVHSYMDLIKSLRSWLYDGVRLQSPRHRSSFCF